MYKVFGLAMLLAAALPNALRAQSIDQSKAHEIAVEWIQAAGMRAALVQSNCGKLIKESANVSERKQQAIQTLRGKVPDAWITDMTNGISEQLIASKSKEVVSEGYRALRQTGVDHNSACGMVVGSTLARVTMAEKDWRQLLPVLAATAGRSANPPRLAIEREFSVRGEEVFHAASKLTFQRCALGQKWVGSECQGTAIQYTEAEVFSKSAAAKLAPWRIPTSYELGILLDYFVKERDRIYPDTVYWTSLKHDTGGYSLIEYYGFLPDNGPPRNVRMESKRNSIAAVILVRNQ